MTPLQPAPAQHVFVNLPCADLARARRFYAGLGYAFDERFSGPASLLVVVSDAIHLMLLERGRFAGFAPRPVAPEGTVGAMVCLSMPSRAAVDAWMERAVAHGGHDNDRAQEAGGFLYGRSLSDPDGNVLEAMWMDMGAAMKARGATAGEAAA